MTGLVEVPVGAEMSRCKSVPTRLRYHPCLSRCDDQGSGIDPSLVSAGRGRLLLADVDHEVITISHGNQPDGGWAWQRNLGICSARGVARRLTGGSVAQGLTSWIGGGGGEGALFLLFGAVPGPRRAYKAKRWLYKIECGSIVLLALRLATVIRSISPAKLRRPRADRREWQRLQPRTQPWGLSRGPA